MTPAVTGLTPLMMLRGRDGLCESYALPFAYLLSASSHESAGASRRGELLSHVAVPAKSVPAFVSTVLLFSFFGGPVFHATPHNDA